MFSMIFAAGCAGKTLECPRATLWDAIELERVECESADRCSGEALKVYDRNTLKRDNEIRNLRTNPAAWSNPDRL